MTGSAVPAISQQIARVRVATRGGGRRDSWLKMALIHLTLVIASIAAAFPIVRIFGVALRPGDKLLDSEFSIIPQNATWESFHHVLFETPFLQWIWNSLVITAGTAGVGLIVAATSAYAFSRFSFRGRSLGLTFLLSTQLIPASMLLVPIYILAVQLGLIGTYRGLVIAYAVTAVPFSIWILKGYYDTVPIDLEEAAQIDGCSQLESFWKVLLPLSTPALAVVGLFNFMTAWNDFLLASVMIGSKESLLTWPLGLQRMQSQFRTEWADLSAASLLVTLPIVILFLYSSKWLVSGVTLGGVKE